MSLRTISDIKLPIGTSESELVRIAEKKLGKKLSYFAIVKKSLDARNKNDVRWVYTVCCSTQPYQEEQVVLQRLPERRVPEKPVLVVGSGPAGLFAAMTSSIL